MTDIELVIKISEEVYEQFRKDQKEKYVSAMISTDIIANATPLPKGHGRLIDADKLVKQYNLDEATKYGNKNAKQQAYSYSTMMLYEIADMIDDAPTIIEADRGDKE